MRLSRTLLAPLRALPDFIIVGAQKAGTTSLYSYLVQHPQIVNCHYKELHFFDREFFRGVTWYRSQFRFLLHRRWMAAPSSRPITGEATPYYMFHPHSPRRMKQVVPRAKLIMILRDPVTRAYSQYQHNQRRSEDLSQFEPLSFEEAIAQEQERLQPELEKMRADESYFSEVHMHRSYASRGIYADQLEEIWKHFPREQTLILKSEAMFAEPQTTCEQAFHFLGVAPHALKTTEARNVGTYDKSRESPTHQQLREFFAPHNQRLYDMIGEDFGW